MLKSSKGITLVALVITIIVLLILAGVVLNVALSDGIINKSQEAVNSYSDQSANETAKINYLTDTFQSYINNVPTAY